MRRGRFNEQQRAVETILILALVAGATQLLETQLARGAAPSLPAERFVAPQGGFRAAHIEFRAEAMVTGPEVRLKQIARWADADAGAMAEVGELIVACIPAGAATTVIELEDVKQTLQQAGIHSSSLRFSGAMACKVSAGERPVIPATVQASIVTQPAPSVHVPPTLQRPARTLRELLTEDLAGQLGLGVESLQIRFDAQDEKVLAYFDIDHELSIEPRKTRRLGDVSWDVTLGREGAKQKVTISGFARAWQTQTIAARPLAFKQDIRPEDVSERRMLVDRLPEDGAVQMARAIGQSAARDISVGSVITGRMLQPPQSARVGQFINVLVEQGAVRVIWVAEARESGARGQAIRVRKPGTREEFTVLLTGPEQGKLLGPAGGEATKIIAKN